MLLTRADEVPGAEREQQAGVNRRRKIISAADRTARAHCQSAEQVLVHSERHVPPAIVSAQHELVGHQIGVGELEAGQGRDTRRAPRKEILHGKTHAGQPGNIIEIERNSRRRAGYPGTPGNERVEIGRFEITGSERGDRGGADCLGLGCKQAAILETI